MTFICFITQHIAKVRLPGLSDDLTKKGKHFILIRNLIDSLVVDTNLQWFLLDSVFNNHGLYLSVVCYQQSFDKVVPSSFHELGLVDMVSVYSELSASEKPPPILDVAHLQQDPEVFNFFLFSLCFLK